MDQSENPMTVVFAADAQVNPAKGVRGGKDGNRGEMHVIDSDGNATQAPSVGVVVLNKGMWLKGKDTSGGGYGCPFERDADRVLHDVLEGYISLERAKKIYGVVFEGSVEEEDLEINIEKTQELRGSMLKN